jgi:hypothetical protein
MRLSSSSNDAGSESATSSDREYDNHTSPISSDTSFGRKDSYDESTTSSSSCEERENSHTLGGGVQRKTRGGPWLEIVGVGVADR